MACSLARASGSTTVVAVDIEQAKLDFAAQMGWATGTFALPKGPRVSGFDAIEVAKSGWAGLQASEAVTSIEGLADGFDAVFECTGVESCMQLAPMVSFRGTILFIPTQPTHQTIGLDAGSGSRSQACHPTHFHCRLPSGSYPSLPSPPR